MPVLPKWRQSVDWPGRACSWAPRTGSSATFRTVIASVFFFVTPSSVAGHRHLCVLLDVVHITLRPRESCEAPATPRRRAAELPAVRRAPAEPDEHERFVAAVDFASCALTTHRDQYLVTAQRYAGTLLARLIDEALDV
jgi:hypothetical protein